MRDRREGLDGEVEGRPSMSMLLPPIELQPPSPPRKSREKEREYATLGSASTVQGEHKLTLSPPLVDGGEPRTPGRPRRSPSSPQSASVGRASPLTPPSQIDFGRDPSAPSVSASASDSTTSSSNNNGDANPNSATTVKDKSKPPSNASTVKARETSAVLRRNSLGDLKIPARISQAQVSLRRDLGMVREFAGAVESLKGLQDTYNCLTGEIHALMERRAAEAGQAAAAARQASASHTPTSPDHEHSQQSSRATSPMGFFNLANLSRTHLGLGGRKGRKRSNTNPEGMPRSSSDGMVGIRTSMLGSTTDLGVQAMPTSSSSPLVSSQAAYKELATALYTINSKYRISWECAELLIELGGGTKDSADGAGSDNTNSKGNPISPTATAGPSHSGISNMASASAVALPVSVSPGMQRSTSKNSTRERAVTLAGDDRSPTPVSRPGSRVGSYGASHNHYAPPLSSPLHSSTGGGFDAGIVNASSSTPAVPAVPSAMGPPGPPLASPSNWRASTGRHDLSQRQLTLLKEMLSQEGPVRGAPNFNAAAYSRLSIAEEPSPPSHMKGTAGQPNREWRWGADAMGSTVTLPASDDEEEGEGGHGTDRTGSRMSGHHAAGKQPKKKRLMNMSGFRDMLRALRRGAQMSTAQPQVVASGPVDAHQGQQALLARTRAAASTTSLSAGSSYDGHSAQGHGYRSPTQGQTRRTLIQKRRPRSSAGGEEVLAQQQRASGTTTPLSPPISQQQHQPPPPPSSFSMPMPVPPKSPRRPSLASIFRIGTSSKNGPPQPFQPGNATDSGSSYLGEEDYTRRRVNPDVDDEEEWDQIDSASDLDGVAGVAGMDATIRGGSVSNPKVLEKKRKKLVVVGSKANAPPGIGTEKRGDVVAVPEKSPYLQQDPYAHRSTSGLGRRIVSAGAAPHSSASSTSINMNASQTSLAESIKESNAPVVPPGNTTNSVNGSMRQAKLSDVQENDAGEAATRASLSLSRQTGQALLVQKGPNPHHGAGNRSVSSSSRFSNANKTGSVRSMPPQPFSPSSISSGSNIVSPYSGAGSAGSGYPDIKLTFTPENIRPLLENAREVQARLKECVEEMRVLVRREEGRSRGAQVDLGVP
ncbi:hypothetical protein DFP72DRAFT_906614 [Ephemerocybe angulata]|uniref:Uncharacterized protein n=1 Tax=Ephemerocybe angulata TaxID=980116 RepID=A0A8H6HTA5_9AGAR|nr:hypothetical protein DFP72DRAFT_906614 [Tulosesus angulatus]